MNNGRVKFFNASKGFGFIKDDDNDKEYFVHVSGLKDQIQQDDHVSFALETGNRGLKAINVKLIK